LSEEHGARRGGLDGSQCAGPPLSTQAPCWLVACCHPRRLAPWPGPRALVPAASTSPWAGPGPRSRPRRPRGPSPGAGRCRAVLVYWAGLVSSVSVEFSAVSWSGDFWPKGWQSAPSGSQMTACFWPDDDGPVSWQRLVGVGGTGWCSVDFPRPFADSCCPLAGGPAALFARRIAGSPAWGWPCSVSDAAALAWRAPRAVGAGQRPAPTLARVWRSLPLAAPGSAWPMRWDPGLMGVACLLMGVRHAANCQSRPQPDCNNMPLAQCRQLAQDSAIAGAGGPAASFRLARTIVASFSSDVK